MCDQKKDGLGKDAPQRAPQRASQVPVAARLRAAARPALLSGAVILASFLTWSLAIASYETAWTVQEHRWVRTVETEINQPVRGEGWDLPKRAKILHTDIRLRTNSPMTTHPGGVLTPASVTEETAYARWYEWDSPNWVRDEGWSESGVGTRRSWPELRPVDRNLREKGRTETLWLVLVGENEARDWRVPEKDWLRMRDGDTIVTESDFWGRVRAVRDEDGSAVEFRP